MGKAFYKGSDNLPTCHNWNAVTDSECRGFEPRMTRREAALILQLSYVLQFSPILFR